MKTIIYNRIKSFNYAVAGMRWAFGRHVNYRIHAALSILVIVTGVYFNLMRLDWLLLIITIALGFVIETINTAIEATLDAVDKTKRDDIKVAKDVSAAAMLIYSIGAIIIALIIFYPYLTIE